MAAGVNLTKYIYHVRSAANACHRDARDDPFTANIAAGRRLVKHFEIIS